MVTRPKLTPYQRRVLQDMAQEQSEVDTNAHLYGSRLPKGCTIRTRDALVHGGLIRPSDDYAGRYMVTEAGTRWLEGAS